MSPNKAAATTRLNSSSSSLDRREVSHITSFIALSCAFTLGITHYRSWAHGHTGKKGFLSKVRARVGWVGVGIWGEEGKEEEK